jgi:hypothetical protein
MQYQHGNGQGRILGRIVQGFPGQIDDLHPLGQFLKLSHTVSQFRVGESRRRL